MKASELAPGMTVVWFAHRATVVEPQVDYPGRHGRGRGTRIRIPTLHWGDREQVVPTRQLERPPAPPLDGRQLELLPSPPEGRRTFP